MNQTVLLALILWAVCGVGAFLVSQARGSGSPGGWFVMGVLLGPIGLVASLFSGPPTPGRKRGARIGFYILLVPVVLMVGYVVLLAVNPMSW